MATRTTISYEGDAQIEVWTEGIHGAVGMVLDAVLNPNPDSPPIEEVNIKLDVAYPDRVFVESDRSTVEQQ